MLVWFANNVVAGVGVQLEFHAIKSGGGVLVQQVVYTVVGNHAQFLVVVFILL
jgi:hypothetical protein